MMHECKRILDKQVACEGLWHTDLSKCIGKQEGEVMVIVPHDEAPDDNAGAAGATEHSDGEGASEQYDGEGTPAEAAIAPKTTTMPSTMNRLLKLQ